MVEKGAKLSQEAKGRENVQVQAPTKKTTSSLNKPQIQKIQDVIGDKGLKDAEKVNKFRDMLVEAWKEQNSLASEIEFGNKKLKQKEQECEKLSKVNSVLEQLSRELQLQKQKILEEREKAIEAERQRHKETNEKFEAAIENVKTKLAEHGDQAKTALMLQEKMVDMEKRIQLTNEHHAKELEAKEIKMKLLQAKSDQQIELLERQLEGALLRGKLQEKLLEENKTLRESLKQYQEQYSKLAETMQGSSKIYDKCKTEMSNMSARINVLENENKTLIERCASQSQQIKKDTKTYTGTIAKQNTQLDKLKALCRTLKQKVDDLEQQQQQ